MNTRKVSKWKLASVAVVAAAGATGVIVGCGGSSGLGLGTGTGGNTGGTGGNPAGALTGQLSSQTLPRLLVDFGLVYGAKDFVDGIENYFTQTGVFKANAPGSSRRLDPRVVTNGCPTVADDGGDNGQVLGKTRTFALSYDGCTPPRTTQPARGGVTVREEVFAINPDNTIQSGNQIYNFGSLDFGGKRYGGEVQHRLNRDPFGSELGAEEGYEWHNMSVATVRPLINDTQGSVTYDGDYKLFYSKFPQSGTAEVNMTTDSRPTFSVTKWSMDLKFNSIVTPRADGTFDVDARLNGTAKADSTMPLSFNGTKKLAGTYEFTLKDVVAKDVCNSANAGTMTIKGANGQARVTFGPECGVVNYSINGGPATKFNAAKFKLQLPDKDNGV